MAVKKDNTQYFRTDFTGEELKYVAKNAGYNNYSEMVRHIQKVISNKGVPISFNLTGETCANVKSFRSNKALGKAMTKACKASFASKACVFEQCLKWIAQGNDIEDLDFPKQMLR